MGISRGDEALTMTRGELKYRRLEAKIMHDTFQRGVTPFFAGVVRDQLLKPYRPLLR